MNWTKLGIAVGVGAIAYSIYVSSKLDGLSNNFLVAKCNLDKVTHIDIEKAAIDQAIKTAVDREVKSAVSEATRDVISKVSSDMSGQVSSAVSKEYSNLSRNVAAALATKASEIDINSLKRDVTEKAKEAVLKKFNDNLDDVLDEFKGNLENTKKIYDTIASAISGKQKNEVVFKIA